MVSTLNKKAVLFFSHAYMINPHEIIKGGHRLINENTLLHGRKRREYFT
jgi:hypothetical protein